MSKVAIEWKVADKRWKKQLPNYKTIAENALKFIPRVEGEISVLLANDKEVHALNLEFRGKDKPTNVLSFPNGEDDILGDIAMSLDTLMKEATSEGKTLENHYTHLFVHGVLHLMGYDHENDEEQEEMESLETKILAKLGVPNPY